MTEKIKFTKMSGCGNDFILIDMRGEALPLSDLPLLSRKLCHRTLSLGADGAIFIVKSEKADFMWKFYNSDGSEAEMCGNGGRCAARFAFLEKIAGNRMSFETLAGIIKAEVKGNIVKTQLTRPHSMRKDVVLNTPSAGKVSLDFLNTGVPHAVIFVEDIDGCNVSGIGREIRFHDEFKPAGTNVNFVKPLGSNSIKVRTYERGVEGETLACGTGSVASAIFYMLRSGAASPVSVMTSGGEELKVYAKFAGDNVSEVFLEGGARVICDGELSSEAWEY